MAYLMQKSSNRRVGIAVAVSVALAIVLIAISWRRQRVLSGPEEQLVGRWRANHESLADNQVYDWVFKRDGLLIREIVQDGDIVVDDWKGLWRIDGSELTVNSKGAEAAAVVVLTAIGYLPRTPPMRIQYCSDGVIILDSGDGRPERLTRVE